MLYIIVIGNRWYLSLNQQEASKFKRFHKGDKIIQVVSDKSVIPGIVYVPNLELLVKTFNLKFL